MNITPTNFKKLVNPYIGEFIEVIIDEWGDILSKRGRLLSVGLKNVVLWRHRKYYSRKILEIWTLNMANEKKAKIYDHNYKKKA